MRHNMWIYLLITVCLFSQCNSREVNNTNKTTVIVKGGDSSMLHNIESFKIGSIEFLEQKKVEDTTDLKGAINGIICSTPYTGLKGDEIEDEFKLFSNQIVYYSYKGDISTLLNDSALITKFYKKATNESDEQSQMEQLSFMGIDSVKIITYGDCIVASFRYLAPTSANQDRPVITFNDERKEIIVWRFSNWVLKKGMIELDFKIRDGKHSLYQIVYNINIKKFIPNCYRIISMKYR